MPASARARRCLLPAEFFSVKAVYVPRSAAGTVESPTEWSRTCSSWICASLSGTAGGLSSPDHPAGARDLSFRSTTRLRAESAVSATEYGSVTLLVTVLRTVGAHTVTAYRYGLPFQARDPVTDQTPVSLSRRMGTRRPSSSRDTLLAVGAQTDRVGLPRWSKTGPRRALRAAP
ncbi:hypothetical protein SGRIM128S_00728 [Streptomyces griseomycini]